MKRKLSLVMTVLLLFSVSSFMFANAKDVKDVKAAKTTQVEKVTDAVVLATANKIKVTLEPVAAMMVNTAEKPIVIKGSINATNVHTVTLYVNDVAVISPTVETNLVDGITQFTISTNVMVTADFSVKVVVVLVDDATLYEKSMKVEVVEIETPMDEEGDANEATVNYPAAPAIAAAYLKEIGIPNRYEGTNIISLVAKEATLKALNKKDPGFEAAVKAFVDAKIIELDEKVPAAAANLTTKETVKNTPAVKVSEKANEQANEKANENAGKKAK